MKKLIKPAFALLITIIIVVASAITVLAGGSVSYQIGEHSFTFEPGSEYSVTDLFTDMKNVMPGDTITQQVTITNDLPDDLSIRVYMRSLGAKEGTEKFLSQMHLKVVDGDNIEVFNDTVDRASEWVHIGTYDSGNASDVLYLTLEVPITMGNEFQENIGYVDWQFKAEEIWEEATPDGETPPGDSTSTPTTGISPDTGDNMHFGQYIVLMLVCSVVLLVTGKYIAKRNHNRKVE